MYVYRQRQNTYPNTPYGVGLRVHPVHQATQYELALGQRAIQHSIDDAHYGRHSRGQTPSAASCSRKEK